MSIKHIKEIDSPTKIDIIIPAAGLGKRMKSYGPKPLIQIKHSTTILDNQLRIIKKQLPEANIILVTGFESDYLMKRTPDYITKIENESYENSNVVKSIGAGLRACRHDVMVIYGDLVFNEACLGSINLNKSSVITGTHIMDRSEVGCIENNKGQIENMMYDLDSKWGQIAFFKGRELDMLKKICWNRNNYNMFGFEAINKIINSGGNFLSCSNDKAMVIDIDTSRDLDRVKEII